MRSAIHDRLARLDTELTKPSMRALQARRILGSRSDDVDELIALSIAQRPEGSDGLVALAEEMSPAATDAAVAESEWITRIQAKQDRWRMDGAYIWVTGPAAALERERFGPIVSDPLWGGKPSTGGLFTSLTGPAGRGAWTAALAANFGVYTPPWHTWRIQAAADARIRVVEGAVDWCELVRSWPIATTGGLGLNWHALAEEFDAVEVSVRSIAAIDAIGFQYEGVRIAPSYWDVQTTVWLNWCFDSTRELQPITL